jgi:hypothetical protein
MRKLLLSLLVAAFHIAITIVLYRERALHQRMGSDVVLFLLPFIAASVGYYLALFLKGSMTAHLVGVIIAPTSAALSLWIAMLYALNTYGS